MLPSALSVGSCSLPAVSTISTFVRFIAGNGWLVLVRIDSHTSKPALPGRSLDSIAILPSALSDSFASFDVLLTSDASTGVLKSSAIDARVAIHTSLSAAPRRELK